MTRVPTTEVMSTTPLRRAQRSAITALQDAARLLADHMIGLADLHAARDRAAEAMEHIGQALHEERLMREDRP